MANEYKVQVKSIQQWTYEYIVIADNPDKAAEAAYKAHDDGLMSNDNWVDGEQFKVMSVEAQYEDQSWQ